MKFLLAILLSLNIFSFEFKVIGPCDDAPLFESQVNLDNSKEWTAGAITVAIFNENNIPYQGAESYMQSIFNSAYGLDAMEVISDFEMNSHGWIFSINGKNAEVYPHEVTIKNEDVLIWYFGYVKYYKGEWASEYLYTNTIRPAQFCK